MSARRLRKPRPDGLAGKSRLNLQAANARLGEVLPRERLARRKARRPFTYDGLGNPTSRGVWIYAYDAGSRLPHATTAVIAKTSDFPGRTRRFKYDHPGCRAQKRSSNLTSNGDISRRYSYEGGAHLYLYAHADPVKFSDPTGHFSMAEIQQVMFVTSTLARIALPNRARFGITVTQRVAASLLRPFFAMVGAIPLATQMGQKLNPWDKFQRLFITPTQSYPGVANWLKDLLRPMGVTLNQHHVFIQQAWYRAGSPNQWYPGETLANRGMQRLGNAGFNLLAIPDGLNRALGAATAAGSAKTAAFATATVGSITMAAEHIWDTITSPFEEEQLQPPLIP